MRVPPNNQDAENAILGTMLLDGGSIAKVMLTLSASDFYNKKNQTIYSAMVSLFNAGDNIDIITVMGLCDNDIGIIQHLSGLTNCIPSVSSLGNYCSIVKDNAKSRRIIEIASDAIDRCYNHEKSKDIADSFGSDFFQIATDSKTSAKLVSELAPGVIKTIEERCNSDRNISGIETGFYDLDKILSGLEATKLYILAGRPAMGKTALAMNILMQANENGVKGLFYSLEMGGEQIVERMLSSASGVNGDTLRKGFLNETSWPKVTNAYGKITKTPFLIDDTPALSITELRARAKMAMVTTGIDLIVVDYMQLMTAPGAQSREREISIISAGLKGLAKELNIPVIALSQLNRSLESRTNKRPILSDLRESGAIEQDADTIMFVYRDEVYNQSEDNPCRGTAELIIAKQRSGPTGTVNLGFSGENTKFTNMIGYK